MNNSFHNLRNKWQQQDGPEVLSVSFETFLNKGLVFAALHLSGKEASLMEGFNCKVTESSVRSKRGKFKLTTCAVKKIYSCETFKHYF